MLGLRPNPGADMTASQALFILTMIALALFLAGAILIHLGYRPTVGIWS